jgi:SAM-dependent methyltransferase
LDSEVYREHVEHEETHWWFIARRAITRTLLNSIKIPENAKILDVGCGAGGNLPLLANYGEVFACEINDDVREHSASRNIGTIAYGKLPDEIPFVDTKFDLITMFDVLEHIEDDRAALAAVATRIPKDGVILLTVPAFQFLFSRHDRQHHHFRRYSKSELRKKVEMAGFKIEHINYWNFFMFIPALFVRVLDFFRSPKSKIIGTKIPASPINNLLAKLVSAERHLFTCILFPFGLSLMLVARKV